MALSKLRLADSSLGFLPKNGFGPERLKKSRFMELQRTHKGHGAKMPLEGGSAHAIFWHDRNHHELSTPRP